MAQQKNIPNEKKLKFETDDKIKQKQMQMRNEAIRHEYVYVYSTWSSNERKKECKTIDSNTVERIRGSGSLLHTHIHIAVIVSDKIAPQWKIRWYINKGSRQKTENTQIKAKKKIHSKNIKLKKRE